MKNKLSQSFSMRSFLSNYHLLYIQFKYYLQNANSAMRDTRNNNVVMVKIALGQLNYTVAKDFFLCLRCFYSF